MKVKSTKEIKLRRRQTEVSVRKRTQMSPSLSVPISFPFSYKPALQCPLARLVSVYWVVDDARIYVPV